MVKTLYIALAGAAGTTCRYLVGVGMARVTSRIPLGTLLVNVVGSLMIGFLMALFAARGELDSRLRLVLSVGFLGGFTTYSAFAVETLELIENHRTTTAALYVAASLAGGVLACAGGMVLSRLVR